MADAANPSLQIGKAQLPLAVERFDHQERPLVRDALENFVHQCPFLRRKVTNCG